MKQINSFILSAILLLSASCGGKQTGTTATTKPDGNAIVLRLQGSFAIGGTVITQPGTYNTQQPFKADGQTLHGDHAYVSYQIPDSARRFLMVFLHGAGQSAKTWESTPDGREGFSTIFLRRHFGTCLIDQPRRGRAGRSTVSEQVIAASLSALCDTLGGSILITHSQGGGPGWHTAIRSRNVKAIVSYELGSGFFFPESETPEPLETISPFGALSATPIPMDDFMKLTRIPIIIYYGDYIPDEPSDNWAMDSWRVRLKMAQLFAECINRHGGDATVVHLPEQGIKGNSHFLFAEKNNVQIANLLSDWLKEKGLD